MNVAVVTAAWPVLARAESPGRFTGPKSSDGLRLRTRFSVPTDVRGRPGSDIPATA
jgi:hypothetical protein